MLYITLGELTACGKKKVLAHEARLGVDERHYVLQMIAKTRGRPGMGSGRSAPTGGMPASGTKASR